MGIDFDKAGHCVKCHKDLIEEKFIDGFIQKVLTPDFDETEFLLNDGSRMRVVICKACKEIITVADEPEIMAAVVKGWQWELDNLVNWDDSKKKDHMAIYSKKEIVTRSEKMDEIEMKKKFKEFHENKSKKDK